MVAPRKVAIVTGASRGIGLAIASELASLGYSLGLISRNRSEIEAVADSLRQEYADVKVIGASVDVAEAPRITDFVDRIHSELGDVSVLVNNAGEYVPGTSQSSQEELQRLLDVNFLAATRFVQATLPSMKRAGSGYIFNVASICGVQAYPEVGSYCASKFALVGYSSALAQELAPVGIKVTALCPSWVNTRMSRRAPIKPEDMIQPHDLALTVRYLLSLSPSASVREVIIHCE